MLTSGNLIDARTDENPNIYGNNITLSSVSGSIGTISEDIDLLLNNGSTGGKLGINSLNGAVNISENISSNVLLNYIYSKNDVKLTTYGNLIDARTDENPNIYGNNITLSSVSGSIGTTSEDIDLLLNNGSTGGKLGINSLNGAVNISENISSNVLLNYIYSKNDVKLTTYGNLIDARTDENPNIYGNNITLSSVSGSIGTISEDIDLFLNNGSTGGKLGINSLNGAVNVSENASSDVLLNYIYSKNDVKLTTYGNLIDARTDENPNIYGNNITLSSVSGSIGTISEDIDLFLNNGSTGGKLGINSLNGAVNVSESLSSEVLLNYIYSKNDVKLTTYGNLIDARTDENPNIYGNNITLSSVSGSIGTTSEDINLFLNNGSTGGKLGINSLNGAVNISENISSNVLLNYIYSKNDVRLSTYGNLIDARTDENPNIYGNNITLSSVSGSIGTTSEDIDLLLNNGSTGGKLGINSLNGAVNISENISSNVLLNYIYSKNNVKLTTYGNLIDARTDENPNIYGNNITLSSTSGSIGTSAEDIDLFLNFSSSGGVLTATANNDLINLYQVSGNMLLNKINSGSNVILKAYRSIYTNTTLPIVNITGTDINLTAATAIGTVGNPIEIDASGSVTATSPDTHIHEN